uniref:Si:ch73-359m17.2 n=1 Tax=Neolamprologus brichardi TaxID=32507 RepID=A0A3Q4GUI2_NEOBR
NTSLSCHMYRKPCLGVCGCQLLYNLALKKTAVQSSTSGTVGIAGKAVDGNRDANYQSGSCTLTNAESDPWWRVDLVNVYTIGTVMITNRQELENGLDGHQVTECAIISHIPKGQAFYFPCNSVKGRYVTVFLPGSAKVLSLCEVEVYYGQLLYNVALKKTAVQSSTSSTVGTAGRAVDGNRDASYQRGSCTLTSGQSNPWWRVDLVNVYTIGTVMITNRDELENRLDGAEIWIGNSTKISDPESNRCAVISHIPSGQAFYFPCNSVKGRYVTVFLPGSAKVLSLCEVEVYYGKPL